MSKETNQRLLDKLQQDLASAGAMPLYLRFNARCAVPSNKGC